MHDFLTKKHLHQENLYWHRFFSAASTGLASFTITSLLAGLGVGTFLIHARFALAGLEQFHLSLSIAIIVLCLASAVWLLCDLRRVNKQA